jgi:hypothetical protein
VAHAQDEREELALRARTRDVTDARSSSRLESEAVRRDDCLVVQAHERVGLEVTVFRE